MGTKQLTIMKKLFITLLLFSGLLFVSCENDTTGNRSKVTHYPIITITGDKLVLLTQGDTYTELGATSLAGTQTRPVITTGTVDTATPGVYKINYKSFNTDGFSVTVTRAVIVFSPEPSTINLEGTWVRNGANVNEVTRLDDRKYKCSNAGGLAGPYTPDDNRVSLIFYNIDDVQIYAPYQENVSPTGLSAETSVGTIVNPDKFTWVLYASGVYGTSLRTFIRQ